MHFYLFCLYYEITPTSCASLRFPSFTIRRAWCCWAPDPALILMELNCMHETNKIELKLIEDDARSYLGLLQVTVEVLFIYYLAFREELLFFN